MSSLKTITLNVPFLKIISPGVDFAGVGRKYHCEVDPLTANKTDTYTIDELWDNI